MFCLSTKGKIFSLIVFFVVALLAGWMLASFYIWRQGPYGVSILPYFWPF